MNILNNMSVNKKLMAGFGIVLLLTAGLGITAYTQVTTMNEAVNLLETADGIEINVLEVRQQEKNFQMRERQVELDRHAEAMTHLHAHVSEAMALVTRSEDRALIAEAESAALAYESAFSELVKETQEMRVLEEECAADARAIENGIRGATYLDDAESAGLLLDLQMIRRDEKNFIMRHDAEYVDEVKGSVSTLQAAIDASALTASDKSAVKREIGTYQATFMELVSIINSIDGYVATTGPLVTHGRAVQASAQELVASAQADADAAAASAKTAVVAFVVIAIILGMLIATVISKSITNPLNEVMIGANKVRDGDFGYDIKVDSKDELGDLARTFGEMKSDLQAIVAEAGVVASEGAKGNLDARAEVEAKGEFKVLVDNINALVDAVAVPVKDCGRVLQLVAGGDLTQKTEVNAQGQLQALLDNTDACVDGMSDIIIGSKETATKVLGTAQGLSSAAEEMNAGMEQLASASQQVAEGSQKLAELAQGTAKNVGEVSAQIDQTSVNASKSAEKGQDATQISHDVQEAAKKTLDGLAAIQEGVAKTSETVTEMNTAIERVGEMGNVITDVAGQTNMLGLNAAIEAARAGEAGRGFAVVADAVKNLAEKVKGAAGESGVAIEHIQESGENAIGATGTAVEEATKGGELMHTALEGVDRVVGAIDEVNSMVQEIDEGAKHASEVVKRVVAGMDEVASISEESASASEESSSAVEEQTSAIQELTAETQGLTETAQELMDNLSRFTVREAEAA